MGGPERTRAGEGCRAGQGRRAPRRLLSRGKAKRQRQSRMSAVKTEGVPHFFKVIGETGVRVVERELKKQGVPAKNCHLEEHA